MTNLTLMKMMAKYDLTTSQSSYEALREILQEIVLLGLYDAGFFRHGAFYGGTALRILHSLPRFSEDLGFSLLEKDESFDIEPFKEAIIFTLKSFGFEVDMEIKEKNSQIASAFIKGNTIKQLLNINVPKEITDKIHKNQTVKIRLEVDTNPPLEFQTENIIRLNPRPFSINAFTLPCLYAGKMHALLCRAWSSRPKGRDWYDLVWYVANGTKLDVKHLKARLDQSCRYLEQNNIKIPHNPTKDNIKKLLLQRIENLDIQKAKNDILPFIKEAKELELWSKEFFIEIANSIIYKN